MVGIDDAPITASEDTGQDDAALARIFSAYIVCAKLWLLFATVIGVLLSLKFVYQDFATMPALSPASASSRSPASCSSRPLHSPQVHNIL